MTYTNITHPFAVFEDVIHVASCDDASEATARYATLVELFDHDDALVEEYEESGSSLVECDECRPLR
jgi:hypothetical protein